jgi:enediyne biosynthesis protein CalE3
MDTRLLLMHQAMLSDRVRLTAYDEAIAAAVEPGDVVVDVGAGALVLSMMALRHGAAHVYSIEADPRAADVAAAIIAENDLEDRITLVVGDARMARLPVRVDVVVSELMGNLGPEEEMVEIVGAVARRHLKPGGRIVPRRLTTFLTPIRFDGEGWGVWSAEHLGYRVDSVLAAAEPEAQLHFFQRRPELLGPPVAVADHELGTTRSGRPSGRSRLPIEQPGIVHAVLGYFRAELGDGIELSNFPAYPGCNWAVWIWPLRHVPVAVDDELVVAVQVPARGSRDVTSWRLDCSRRRRDASGSAAPRPDGSGEVSGADFSRIGP